MRRTYCDAWPDPLKEAEARRYRAACRIRMLEGMLDRIGPDEFDSVMEQLEATHTEVQAAGAEVQRLKHELKEVYRFGGYTFT